MGVLYLLDTNIASHLMRGDHSALNRNVAHIPVSRLALSVVTEAELFFGAARRPALRIAVEKFVQRIRPLSWDSIAARAYAELRAGLEKLGISIDALDMMIAAHALALGATLITHDKAFARIKGLKVADWTKA